LSREILKTDKADPLVRQLQHFCRVIRGEEAPRVSGADATRTLEVVQDIRKAVS
jgi:predicted dehydrogenase